MKVSELEGDRLNYWVARAEGYEHLGAVGTNFENDQDIPWCRSDVNDWWRDKLGNWLCGPCQSFPYAYSTDWSQGGPIIEREGIQVAPMRLGDGWEIKSWRASRRNCGALACDQEAETPLIAAMRCFVASKFGEEVPD